MPCLNEEKTVGDCVLEAIGFLRNNHINGEVLVVDNGSTDESIRIAAIAGARVVSESVKGYGAAIKRGIKEAYGDYIITGDCDMSYDFSSLQPFMEKLEAGYDFVNGNRFKGGIEKGAMPLSHKIGVPILSIIANLRYKTGCKDFHCGIRGFRAECARNVGLSADGFESTTETIAKFKKAGYKMTEVPTKLRKDGRNHKPHLKTIPDGFRHLRYIILEQ